MTIHVLATGGTIASHRHGDTWLELNGAQLVAELDLATLGHDVVVDDVAAGPSSNLSVVDMLAIAERVRLAIVGGATGVVVTHGTDTIELTAFLTELVLGIGPTRPPVVFTGSMRVHSHPEPDGPANLRDALMVAAHPDAVGREVMVALDGRLHAATHVAKVHAGSLDAFTSHPFEPLGSVCDGRPVFAAARPAARTGAAVPDAGLVEVALVTCYPGMGPDELAPLLAGRQGAVVEAFGDLNAPRRLWRSLHAAAQSGTLVVLASRAFTDTTRTDDLDQLGVVGAGGLSAQKARLALMVALSTSTDRDDAIAMVHRHCRTLPIDERSSRHD